MVLSRQAGILILDKQTNRNSEQKSSEQQSLNDIISSREDGFGFILKQHREQKNISLAEVAKELHLDEKFIIALDNEDYTKLPAPAFVCGYIRNYAKLVGIQPEPLIADYKKSFGHEVTEPELRVSRQKNINNSSIQNGFFVLIFKIILLAGLVFGSWQLWLYVSENFIYKEVTKETLNEFSLGTMNSSNTVADTIADNDPETLLLPVIDAYPLDEVNQKQALTGQQLAQDNPELKAGVEVESIAAPIVDSVIVPDTEVFESSETVTSVEQQDVQENVEVINSEDSANSRANETEIAALVSPADSSLQPLTSNQLILEFAANSWIKIKDASGKTLASGTKKSGTVLTLSGQRPYKVIIGNANKVKVSIDGQLFDHSGFINENTIARYTLP